MKHCLFTAGALAIAGAGCGPGLADGTEQIGDTPYEITSTSTYSNWLHPRADCRQPCPSINRDVIRYRSNASVIAVRRRVVRDTFCPGLDMIDSQWLDAFEQYIIVLDTNQLLGPFTVAQYDRFVRQHPALVRGIDLLDTKDRTDGGGVRQQDGRLPSLPPGCKNPRARP